MDGCNQKIESWEQAQAEHYLISKAMIEKDTVFLLLQYGSLKNAEKRLEKLEHYLNYKEEKEV